MKRIRKKQSKPVTGTRIHRLRGILKRKPGDKSFAQEWAEYKAEEKTFEDAKYVRIIRL